MKICLKPRAGDHLINHNVPASAIKAEMELLRMEGPDFYPSGIPLVGRENITHGWTMMKCYVSEDQFFYIDPTLIEALPD